MIKTIKILEKDIVEFNTIAKQHGENIMIHISQGHISINAKSLLGFYMLDFSKPMKLIIYDQDADMIFDYFRKWIVEGE